MCKELERKVKDYLVEEHIKMWNYIIEQASKEKERKCIKLYKLDYFLTVYDGKFIPRNSCFLCSINSQRKEKVSYFDHSCSLCPAIIRTTDKGSCLGGLYAQLSESRDREVFLSLAQKIRDICPKRKRDPGLDEAWIHDGYGFYVHSISNDYIIDYIM